MAKSRGYAARLIRSLDLPREASQLLSVPKYRNRDVVWALLKTCDRLRVERPEDGLAVARVASELATRVDPREELPLLHARAHATLASALRAVGDLVGSEGAFGRAFAYCEGLAPLDRVELYYRKAHLRRDQWRFGEALELVNEAQRLFRLNGDLSDRHLFGCTLLVRGQIFYEMDETGRAIRDISAALNHLDLKRGEMLYHAALHNLAWCLAHHVEVVDLHAALKQLKRARGLLTYRPRHLSRGKIQWLEGVILVKFGLTRRGEHLLAKAREMMVKLKVPYETALVSLDLGALYLQDGRLPELRGLATETYELCRRLSLDREALSALTLWCHAVREEELTDQVLSAVRARMNARCVSLTSATA